MAMRPDGQSSRPKPASKPKSVGNPSAMVPGMGGFAALAQAGQKAKTAATTRKAAPPQNNIGRTPQARQSSGGTGTSYSGSPLSATGTGVMAAQAPPQPMGLDQFKADGNNYNKDAAYMSETASADADYKNLIDQLTRQNTNYTSDFESGLRNMGLDWAGNDYASGNWDPTDKLGSYGQAFDNTQNDFSGRGMLDSSFYGQAQQGVTDRFNRQRNSLMDGLNQENASFAANKTAGAQGQQQAQQRAMAEAYNRYVAGFGA